MKANRNLTYLLKILTLAVGLLCTTVCSWHSISATFHFDSPIKSTAKKKSRLIKMQHVIYLLEIPTKISVYCLHGVYPDWNFGCQMTVRLSKTVSSFTLFLDYVTANTCKNNVNEHHNILSSKFCKTQNLSLPILLATTIDVNCIIIGSHECTVEHKRPTSVSGFSLNNILTLPFVFHQTISYSPRTLGIYDLL